MLWDLNEGKHLYTLDAGDNISSLVFSPNRYWLCAAAGPAIKIWVRLHFLICSRNDLLQVDPCGVSQDLEGKTIVDTLKDEVILSDNTNKTAPRMKDPPPPQCLSLAWSADGQTLFAGYSDNKIRVWQVSAFAGRD